MKRVAAIVLAAGSSSRLGEPKQLLMVDGEPMLKRVIRLAGEAGASPVFVILGAHREKIEKAVALTAAEVLTNPGWQEGIASSIRVGIEALQAGVPDAEGVLLVTSDQPRITVEHLRRMIDAFARTEGTAMASFYAGGRGIPAIFPADAFPDLLALKGDQGARGLLLRSPWPVQEFVCQDALVDIDRPEDLIHLR